MKKSDRKKGFTMVELIVVIVIILVLAAVLVPSLLKYIRKAQEAAAIEECAGVVKMAAVERSEWLAEGGTAPTNAEIVHSAGANGEINIVKYSDDDFDVTYMRYICKNGIVVIYEYDKDPQFRIEGKDESSPSSIINDWIQKANDLAIQMVDGNRANVIEAVAKNGGLLSVDESFTDGTKFEGKELYWRPYYIGSVYNGKVSNLQTMLFANDMNGSNIYAGWYAKIVYIDGKKYVSTKDGGSNIAAIHGSEDINSAIEWLDNNEEFEYVP